MSKTSKTHHILGIESSGLVSGACISQEDELLAQSVLKVKNIHSRQLAVLVEQLLDHLQLKYTDMAAVTVSAGPGSFTGLRIGYSLAKGFAHALNIPIIEVPTLDIWAFQHGQRDMPILSIIDAHRDEIFCGVYVWRAGKLYTQGGRQLVKLVDLKQILLEPMLIVGGDILKLKDQISDYGGKNAVIHLPIQTEPESWAHLKLAHIKFLDGEYSNLESCEPLYMRAFKGVM
jgi:tRNA threonylcarbamoyladenosine biosynthesis protein TsaB